MVQLGLMLEKLISSAIAEFIDVVPLLLGELVEEVYDVGVILCGVVVDPLQ